MSELHCDSFAVILAINSYALCSRYYLSFCPKIIYFLKRWSSVRSFLPHREQLLMLFKLQRIQDPTQLLDTKVLSIVWWRKLSTHFYFSAFPKAEDFYSLESEVLSSPSALSALIFVSHLSVRPFISIISIFSSSITTYNYFRTVVSWRHGVW